MRVLFALAALTLAAPLAAQNTTDPAPAPAPAAAPKYTVETPLETIVADPAGKAVLEATMPALLAHPMFNQFKSMSLKDLQPMSGGKITDEALVKVGAALATVK